MRLCPITVVNHIGLVLLVFTIKHFIRRRLVILIYGHYFIQFATLFDVSKTHQLVHLNFESIAIEFCELKWFFEYIY
jgi:hypothetical protein